MKEQKKQEKHTTQLSRDLKQLRDNNAVRQRAGAILWLAVATFVLALVIAGVGIAYILDVPAINQRDAQICLLVFLVLAFASTISLATVAVVMLLVLMRDKKLSGLSLWSIVIIFIFAAAAVVLRIINLLSTTGILNTLNDQEKIICYATLLAAPIVFIIFGALLFKDVCRRYAAVEQQGAK